MADPGGTEEGGPSYQKHVFWASFEVHPESTGDASHDPEALRKEGVSIVQHTSLCTFLS